MYCKVILIVQFQCSQGPYSGYITQDVVLMRALQAAHRERIANEEVKNTDERSPERKRGK